ncbi:ABC transporter ATP-binding protein [Promicromonospora iranensis]|uniref:ABC transport system ATP-binding protein n=1 Tax=Promicromonospora iranensis TaxID=1105144 RepID=A0ABU2CW06_9MICO|nr:ABC transporter ATP-binding protein [Promicromonospora iranensis]MDR7385511.1 putative ABC transport system ATP-binding protein [Promicromonospora iranensis]
MTTTSTAPAAAVVLDGITRTYRSRSGNVDALRGVTHVFPAGTFTAVMGPSGSGKSTLMQIAAGLDRPTTGGVTIAGIALKSLDKTRLTKLRRATMSFVFQQYNLLDALTAFDNVALPVRLAGRRADRAAVLEALDRVGLRDLERRRPPEMSGGQQQRVAIARALHARPAVLFADEPTGALDRATGRDVLTLLRALADHGQTVVMVTHDPLAASYADTVLFLADGLVVGQMRRGDATQIAARMTELER